LAKNSPRNDTQQWARQLLVAVDKASAPELMDLLATIIQASPSPERRERERMELLQGIALKMRLDLHAMLMHIYQRLEASRTYLDVVRHLADEGPQDAPPRCHEVRDEERPEAATACPPNAPVLSWPKRSDHE